ncbi:hypothetical protein D3C76_390820 [compost metagenome]
MDHLNHCKAAFAQKDITPDFPVELIGCYREDSTASGVLHSLFAQVLLLEMKSERYCIIAIDSLGLTIALSSQLRVLVAEQLKTDISHVMLNFSHTHSAPAPLSALNGSRYFQLLCDRVIDCVQEAVSGLQPCLMGWAVTEAEVGENRRDGCSITDKRLGALQVVRASDKAPIMLLLRVNAHANVLMTASNKISSDYFGKAREQLAEHYGCPVMLLQGAAGNLKPVGVDKIHGGALPDIDCISAILLQSATQLRFNPSEVTSLSMCEKELLFHSDVPLVEEAERIANEAQTLFEIEGKAWLNECQRLREAGITVQTQKRSIQFLFLNDGCICGLPDEIFCELALEAVEQAGSPLLFLNGYTNGVTGYLPHSEEWAKGGYETLYSCLIYYLFHGHVMPFRQDTAKQMVDTVTEQWKCNKC